MKNIVILATGGTIAGRGDAGKTSEYKPGEVSIADILSSVPGIEQLAHIEAMQILNAASDNVTSENLLQLANTINELSQKPNIDGFVITHGTDTLEETAYFLHLTVKTHKPVVCVGSMRPATALSADGPLNLYQAVALATKEEAAGKGVLVTFADGIYSARDVQKVNTFRTDAFSGRDLGCLGYMQDATAHFFNQPVRKHTADTEFHVSGLETLPKVDIIYFHLDADLALFQLAYANSAGVVIATAGNGGISSAWGNAMKSPEMAQKPIVTASRIGNGYVNLKQSAADTVVASGSLNPQKARILLQLALTVTRDVAAIRQMFLNY